MGSLTQVIPEVLVYEMKQGLPVYYKGYRQYLSGEKQLDQIMGSSKIQAMLIAELIFLFRLHFGDEYLIFANELGVQFSKKDWRAVDISVVLAERVKEIDNKYLKVPPQLVVEIDTKAELNEIQNPLGYYQEKTQELIGFGVDKVIWVFTDTKKVLIAEIGKDWSILDWAKPIQVTDELSINIEQIIAKRSIK